MSAADVARRAVGLLDLTSLDDDDTPERIAALCRQAVSPAGAVAAVCVYPRWVPQALAALAGSGVRVATVANFPGGGGGEPEAVRGEVAAAVADGAEEVDVVLPWERYAGGDRAGALAVVDASRAACGDGVTLKVILETGRLGDAATIHAAAADVLEHGADFVKTSTGKLSPGATLDAAEAMLAAIAAAGGQRGFKAAGGIRTTADAAAYLGLADAILGPGYATAERFRLGASSLLADLLAELGLAPEAPAGSEGY